MWIGFGITDTLKKFLKLRLNEFPIDHEPLTDHTLFNNQLSTPKIQFMK